eukprot:m.96802 g.96802  ORF g.96802 m.96802 type:complete len:1549 (+) comp15204_c0_seq2:375-5021(+)
MSSDERLLHRLVDACIVVGINLDANLPPIPEPVVSRVTSRDRDSIASLSSVTSSSSAAEPVDRVFDVVYREFAVQHVITGDSHAKRLDPMASLMASPRPVGFSRQSSSKGATPSYVVPTEVFDTLPMFCFPDGAKVFSAVHLPSAPGADIVVPHNMLSFVMSESGYYATAVTYHRQTHAAPLWAARAPVDQPASPPPEGSDGSKRPATVLLPHAVCLISRWPHFTAMRDCLACLLPKLLTTDDPALILEPVIAQLSRVPVLSPGRLKLRFQLEGRPIQVRAQPQPTMPLLDVSLRLLFLCLSPAKILTVFKCLLLEHRTVVFSQDMSLLTPVIQGLLGLMYPLKWMHICIPVLPSHMRSFIEAPWPFLVGMNSRYADELLYPDEDDGTPPPVIVNLDTGEVSVPPDVTLFAMPEEIESEFVFKCNKLPLHYELSCVGSVSFCPEDDAKARASHEERLQSKISSLFLAMMASLLGDIRRYILFDVSPPVLNLEKFLSSRPEQSHDFYRSLSQTGCFQAFKRRRDKQVSDFFDKFCERPMDEPVQPSNAVFELPSFDDLIQLNVPSALVRTASSPRMQRTKPGDGDGKAAATATATHSRRRSMMLSPQHPMVGSWGSSSAGKAGMGGLERHGSGDGGHDPASPDRFLRRPRSASLTSSNSTFCRRSIAALTHRVESCSSSSSSGSGGSSSTTAVYGNNGGSTPALLVTSDAPSSGTANAGPARTTGKSSILPQLLHLRAVFKIAMGDVLEGFRDLNDMWKINPDSFPKKLVREIVASLSEGTRRSLKAFDFYREAPVWRELDAAVAAGAVPDDDGHYDTESGDGSVFLGADADANSGSGGSRSSSSSSTSSAHGDGPGSSSDGNLDAFYDNEVQLPEIGSVSSILQAVEGGARIDRDNFTAISKVLGITEDVAAARNLFDCLTSLSVQAVDEADTLGIELFTDFVETWRTSAQSNQQQGFADLIQLEAGERVVKIKPLVHLVDSGIGTLVLTHQRVFVVTRSKKVVEVFRLSDVITIEKLQYKKLIPPGVPSLKIICSPPTDAQQSPRAKRPVFARRQSSLLSAAQRATTAAGGGDCMEVNMLFFSERDAWHGYLTEMAAGHQVARGTKDPSVIMRAAQNIELAEAVSKVSVAGSPARGRSRNFSPHVLRMLPLSNTPIKPVPQSSLDTFVRKIDPSPFQMRTRKPTVECMVSLNDQRSVMCGLASGQIQVIEVGSGDCVSLIGKHRQRVTALLVVDDHVWTGSFGLAIHIIDIKSRKVIASLDRVDDAVSCLLLDGEHKVWSATLSGKLQQWDAKNHKLLRTIDVAKVCQERCKFVRSVIYLNGELWCCLGNKLVVLDCATGLPRSRSPPRQQTVASDEFVPSDYEPTADAPRDDKPWIVRTRAAHSLVIGENNEVWSCSNEQGLVHIWDVATLQLAAFGGEWRIDCGGINCLAKVGRVVWAGAHNHSVYTWDVESHSLLKELRCHEDLVRCLCPVETTRGWFVLSGSGSQDGTIVVWNCADASSNGADADADQNQGSDSDWSSAQLDLGPEFDSAAAPSAAEASISQA